MKFNDFNFDDEFEPFGEDEELFRKLKEIDEKDNQDRMYILNPDEVRKVRDAYRILKKLASDTGAKIEYSLDEEYPSEGGISIEGKNLVFDNPAAFTAAAELASNVEIFPKTNGNVLIGFTFHNLATRLK